MAPVPTSVRLRTYNVGFGDCFLLTFRYESLRDHHMLIDCGTTKKPTTANRSIDDCTEHIRETVMAGDDERLDVIVATNRHEDHISGFGGDAGANLVAANPGLIVQPWTEDPSVEPDATAPPVVADASAQSRSLRYTHQLASMQVLMQELKLVIEEGESNDDEGEPDEPDEDEIDDEQDEASPLSGATKTATKQVKALGTINSTNRPAVEALRTMGSEPAGYLHYGMDSGIEEMIPGIEVHVLGPPTVEQWDGMRRHGESDDSEFWRLAADAFAPGTGTATSRDSIFPGAATEPRKNWVPPVHWLVPKLRKLRGNQMLSLVRILDRAVNNTSLILLIKVGNRRLLFSGDAHVEAWEYPLLHAPDKARVRRELQWIDVYKVGHHGSMNATPKSLWNMFKRRGTDEDQNRLITLLSTKTSVHGYKEHGTEVPCVSLVEALKESSSLTDSRDYTSDDQYFTDVEISTSKHRPLVIEP